MQEKEVIKNIRTILRPGKWEDQLWSFLSSRDMTEIIKELMSVKVFGRRFVPSVEDALYPYTKVPWHKVKVVILCSLKSNSLGMSKLPLQQSIRAARSVLATIDPNELTNSEYWNRQGVLQISTAMTSTMEGDHHYDIWKLWTAYVINKLNEKGDIPWIIVGKQAESYWKTIGSYNRRIVKVWPEVNCNNAWDWCNEVLVQRGEKLIQWKNTYNKEPVSK